MIVKDEESIEEALQIMTASPGGVRYSDEYSYITIKTPGTLELQCRRALARNSIAIVVTKGLEREMEDHGYYLRIVRKQRAEDEKKAIKEWVRDNPRAVEILSEKLKKAKEREE